MRLAESVTFGGSGLDRAATFRGDAEAMAAHLATGAVLPLWQGMPLVADGALGWLPAGHPALVPGGPPVFLGLDDGVARFAQDLPDRSGVPLPGGHDFAELRGIMTGLTPRAAELAATARALLQWHATHGFCAACGAASAMAMAGWQRSCPACGAHHFPRTDPVVIMLVTRGNKVLVGRSPGWPEGMYSLLAGFMEPGETVEAAVRREVFEETGIRVGPVRYLASQPWPFPASLMLGCGAEALDDVLNVDPAEIEDALWLTREEMVRIMAGQHPTIRAPRAGAIAHFLVREWLADRLD
jgi:NAD+ diphosphatase